MKIALIGNPNSGKTSLFNLLTGLNQKIGNLPSITVEEKKGQIIHKKLKGSEVVDLPGILSLNPDTEDQRLTQNYLSSHNPDLIINVIDSTNISRSLYITLQLRAFNLPIIVLLNMTDEAKKTNIEIDEIKLSQLLNMPVIKASILKSEGIDNLTETINKIINKEIVVTPSCASCKGCTTCSQVSQLYKQVDLIVSLSVKYFNKVPKRDFTKLFDLIALNKFIGLPVFLFIMFLVFTISFSPPIMFLSEQIHYFMLNSVSNTLEFILQSINSPIFIITLFCEGVIPGISAVLSFLPQISMLFILLSLIEYTGYMTRAAFLTDKLLSFTGLSGSSFIPMIMSFGCSVPAITSCRTLPSKKDKLVTIMVIPFIACGARFPIIALFAGTFFDQYQGLFVFLMYLLGVVVSLVSALIINQTGFKKERSDFIMEMPPYRAPIFKNLMYYAWQDIKGFLIKAGTTLFLAAVIIWFLSNYSITLTHVTDMTDSILAMISNLIAIVFNPLGFGTWQASASLITGVGAKEMIVSTLAILYPDSIGGIAASFTVASAVSFVVFSLLYLPCASTIITMQRELKSFKLTGFALLFSFVVAYVLSFVIYRIILGVF